MVKPEHQVLDDISRDRIIEMAWEDRTPFEAIEHQYGLSEPQVIALMRRHLKRGSFQRWRARVTARKTKHAHKRSFKLGSFQASTHNKPR